jgi:hypothetical protein
MGHGGLGFTRNCPRPIAITPPGSETPEEKKLLRTLPDSGNDFQRLCDLYLFASSRLNSSLIAICVALRTHFETLRIRLGTPRTHFATSRSHFGKLRTHFGSRRTRFERLRTHFGRPRTHFWKPRIRFGILRTRFGNLHGHFARLRTRLATPAVASARPYSHFGKPCIYSGTSSAHSARLHIHSATPRICGERSRTLEVSRTYCAVPLPSALMPNGRTFQVGSAASQEFDFSLNTTSSASKPRSKDYQYQSGSRYPLPP